MPSQAEHLHAHLNREHTQRALRQYGLDPDKLDFDKEWDRIPTKLKAKFGEGDEDQKAKMNLALIDPFQLSQDWPTHLTNEFRSGHATCLRWNRKGDYLAAGRVDGKVIVWDMETMGVAMKMCGHVAQIQSLSWSRCGRYLLSASQDWNCVLWDLADGSQLRHVTFDAPCYIAELHPYNHFLFVACLYDSDPRLVDISEKDNAVDQVLPTQQADDENDGKAAKKQKQSTTTAIFTSVGNHIISGTTKGSVNIIETESRRMLLSTKLGQGVISSLRLSGNGRDLLINCSDRTVRVVQLPDLTGAVTGQVAGQSAEQSDDSPDSSLATALANLTLTVKQKFLDVVQRHQWNHVCFSANAEYVTASTYMRKEIYIWERSGGLKTMLECREEPGAVEWHPNGKPMLATSSVDTGNITIWHVEPQQKWSALAPDFKEVDNNVEYMEQENEFDVAEASEINQRLLDQEDEEVNIIRIERLKGEEEESFVLPVLMDIENSDDDDDLIAVGVGTMRRREANEGREWNQSEDEARSTPAPRVRNRAGR